MIKNKNALILPEIARKENRLNFQAYLDNTAHNILYQV